jgi:hypothetical protein
MRKRARPVLCGGRSVMTVPTATGTPHTDPQRSLKNSALFYSAKCPAARRAVALSGQADKLSQIKFDMASRPVCPAPKAYRQRTQTAGKQKQRAGFGYSVGAKCPDHACRFREGTVGVGVIQFSGRVGVSGSRNRA